MVYLASRGYRCIAHDRRGHGRSSQPWNGNEMDTFADDLSALIDTLDLKGTTLVGHSMGGGEVARYIGRHGTKRVARAVLVAAVPPLMLKTDANPGGLPITVFDGIRAGVAADRSQFFKDLTTPFFGANRPGAKVSRHAGPRSVSTDGTFQWDPGPQSLRKVPPRTGQESTLGSRCDGHGPGTKGRKKRHPWCLTWCPEAFHQEKEKGLTLYSVVGYSLFLYSGCTAL
jgi:pimeloyl-ACP methyl ester carboxylesterase